MVLRTQVLRVWGRVPPRSPAFLWEVGTWTSSQEVVLSPSPPLVPTWGWAPLLSATQHTCVHSAVPDTPHCPVQTKRRAGLWGAREEYMHSYVWVINWGDEEQLFLLLEEA